MVGLSHFPLSKNNDRWASSGEFLCRFICNYCGQEIKAEFQARTGAIKWLKHDCAAKKMEFICVACGATQVNPACR